MLTDEFKTTRDFWSHAVMCAPQQLAAVHLDRRLTYQQADRLTDRLAAGIQAKTQNASPVVAVCLPNCMDYYLLYWALVKAAGIIVPINPWLKRNSLEDIFRTVRPDALVVQGNADAEPLAAAAKALPGLPIFSQDDSFQNLRDLFIDREPIIPPLSPEAPSIIMHTSGTTAAPKGAVMRHVDLVFNVMTTIAAQDFRPTDVHVIVNPMFHCTALYSSLPACAAQMTPAIITAETQPEPLLKLIQDEQATTLLTVPAILQRIVSLPSIRDYRLDSLRVIGYAGSFMPVKTVRQLQQLFPKANLHNFFGLTETISATHAIDGKDSIERPDSIGRLLPNVRAIVVDENLRTCPPNTVGELLFARENVIREYWGKPGRLEESLVDIDGRTWFRTGDLATVDQEGFAFIKGRKKDMIIVGGENVFAAEVEAAVMLLDSIRECAVIGIPATGIRESLGELIKLFVVPEPGAAVSENDIRRHCHKTLPSYKLPHVIQFLDRLPRNPSGKVLKAELK